MLEDIKVKDFPRVSGVYKVIWNGAVIYIGSSNNLYKRMSKHRTYIKQGSNNGSKKGFYLFLQNNPFTVEFELTENYRQKEQELIEYYEPIYNQNRSFTGCGTIKGRESEYWKERYQKFKEEQKQYREAHKEEKKQYHKQYYTQKCIYEGEILTLGVLKNRFHKQGIPHPVLEAKKYLI